MQVVFSVADLARSLDFYERSFDWPRNTAIDFGNYAELLPPDGGALGLYEAGGFAREVGAAPAELGADDIAPSYLYVRVDDVDATCARLASAGARPLSGLRERDWGERAAWFADPDGNVVAVAAAREATPPA